MPPGTPINLTRRAVPVARTHHEHVLVGNELVESRQERLSSLSRPRQPHQRIQHVDVDQALQDELGGDWRGEDEGLLSTDS